MRSAFAQGNQIGLHHVRQQGGAHRAVGRGEHPANRRGKSVDCPQAGVGQGQPAEKTGNSHVQAGGFVGPIVEGASQRTGRAPDAFDTNRVGQRIGAAGNIGFDELCERVQAGGGGQLRGEVIGEFRIDQRDLGQQQRTAQADFEAMPG